MLDGFLDPFLLWISTEVSVLFRLQAIRKTVAGDAQILDHSRLEWCGALPTCPVGKLS